MILVDTSIWISHFRSPSKLLGQLLLNDEVLISDMVIAELALGSIPERRKTLRDLSLLPRAQTPTIQDTLTLIEKCKLYSSGLSLVDVMLIATALIEDSELLSEDRKLMAVWNNIR